MLEVIFLENNFLEKDYEGETRKYESMLSWIIRWTFDAYDAFEAILGKS